MKRCRTCGKKFKPKFDSMREVTCSPDCGIAFAATQKGLDHRRKAFKAETRERKAALKTRSEWLKEAQTAFNAWIRFRDEGKPCISCGITMPSKNYTGNPGRYWHAGHYRSVAAAPELRFHEDNCHRQCSQCNAAKSGNATEYRIGLVNKLGPWRVEFLEGPHKPKRYTIDEIKEIKRKYKELVKKQPDLV